MTGHFNFAGDYPRWEDADENLYEQSLRGPSFDELVDKLMYLGGLDRDEAEQRATRILEDDAA